MKALTDDELRMNQEAIDVASMVLDESVKAAARCEQVTKDMVMEAAGVGGMSRGFIKGSKGFGKMLMPRTMGDFRQMEDGGLPGSFVLAVTADKVHALEDKHQGGRLVAGKVLKSWDRATFMAKGNAPGAAIMTGITEDRQILTIYLPLDGGKSKYMKAAVASVGSLGGPGMPHKVAIAKDDASKKLIDVLAANAPAVGANIRIGGQSLEEMMAQASGLRAAAAQPAIDPTEQLERLSDLRDRGILTDDEFAAQKAKILGAG